MKLWCQNARSSPVPLFVNVLLRFFGLAYVPTPGAAAARRGRSGSASRSRARQEHFETWQVIGAPSQPPSAPVGRRLVTGTRTGISTSLSIGVTFGLLRAFGLGWCVKLKVKRVAQGPRVPVPSRRTARICRSTRASGQGRERCPRGRRHRRRWRTGNGDRRSRSAFRHDGSLELPMEPNMISAKATHDAFTVSLYNVKLTYIVASRLGKKHKAIMTHEVETRLS